MTGLTARAAGGAIVAGVGLMPLIAILAPRGLAILLVVLTLANLAHGGNPWRDRPLRRVWVIAILAGLLAWGLLSLLWVGDPSQGIIRWLKLAIGAVCGLTLIAGVDRLNTSMLMRVGRALSIGLVIGLIYLVIDLALDGAPRKPFVELPVHWGRAHLNRGLTMSTFLIWPAALWLWRRWRPAAPVAIILCGVVLFQAESDSAFGAYILGAAVFAAVLALPRRLPAVLAAAVVVATLAAPLIPRFALSPDRILAQVADLPSPMVHRLYIWQFTADRIAERPLTGWGLDAARDMPGRNIGVTQVNPALSTNVYGQMTLMPLHPHNAPLQFWLELGLPGALAFAAIVGGLLFGAGRMQGRADVAVSATVILVGLSLSSFSYGIWQSWWQAGLWLTAGLTIAALRLTNRPD